MKRPSFQFYPADWRNNANLRRCSPAARGVWMDVLCVLHDSDEYGVCRWPLVDLANAAGASLRLLRELVAKEVLKGGDRKAAPYIHTPRHAGKDGEPIVLVDTAEVPCWYSTRLVRDEWVRGRRGVGTRFDEANQPPSRTPTGEPNSTPTGPPTRRVGEGSGDGPSSSSSSSEEQEKDPPTSGLVERAALDPPAAEGKKRKSPGYTVPDCPYDALLALYHEALPTLPRVEVFSPARKATMRSRWVEVCAAEKYDQGQGVQFFRDFFAGVRTSKFLTGGSHRNGHEGWRADLDFLLTPSKFAKVIEGRYHGEHA